MIVALPVHFESSQVKSTESQVIHLQASQAALVEQDEPETAPSKSFIYSLYQLWNHALPSAYSRTAHGMSHACGEVWCDFEMHCNRVYMYSSMQESVIACGAA